MPPADDAVRGSAGRVTIAQVARRAGVSPTTVSHVLSGKRPVSSPIRDQVRKAVRDLGYRPSSVARHLRTKRSQIIAVIVPDITNPFYTGVSRGLADAVDAAGYGTYIGNTDAMLERERKFVDDVLDRGVDGFVIASAHVVTEEVARAVRYGTPVVCLGGSVDHPAVDVVLADDEAGSRLATTHLISRGARRIAMIQGTVGSGNARDRGYRSALADAGLSFLPELTEHGDWTRQGGREAMRVLLARKTRPDAVFCANDLMAIGALDAIRAAGLTIPSDIALVGFDDVEAAGLVTPALTTVTNPSYDAGQAAGRLLLDRIDERVPEHRRTIRLPCRLVERESA